MMNDEKHYTILIVDDEPANIKILHELLRDDYRIRVANSGEKALEMVETGKLPDLILLDVMMPGINGYEVCSRLKQLEQAEKIPVIFLSGKNETDEIVRGFKAGAVDYVTKPFQPEELLTRLETQLALLETKKKLEQTNDALLKRNIEIEQGMETARSLQRNLLPGKKLQVEGVDSHFCYIPMDMVGGDFYDYRIDGRRVELLIADVSGHGLPGALFSTVAKVVFETIDERSSPRSVLRRLNRVMCQYTVESHFITAVFCLIDLDRLEMRFSSAGHCPLLLDRRCQEQLLELKTPGLPLGVFEEVDYEEQTMALQPQDRLVIYTDGVIECERQAEDGAEELWGADRFSAFIAGNRSNNPEKFVFNLIETLTEFTGRSSFADDITLGVVDVIGRGAG